MLATQSAEDAQIHNCSAKQNTRVVTQNATVILYTTKRHYYPVQSAQGYQTYIRFRLSPHYNAASLQHGK